MNPTKAFPWLLAALPVMAVIVYMAVPGQKPKAPQPAATTVPKAPAPDQKKKPPLAADGSRIRKLTPEQQLAKDKSEEATRRATEAFQKMAEHMTPEYCAQLAESILQRRRENYGKLLDSWSLDAGKTREVTEILRSREVRRMQNMANYFQDAYNPKNLKAKTSQDQTEDHVARETLNLSLGEARANDLLNVMTQAEANDLKLAEQMTQKRKGTR